MDGLTGVSDITSSKINQHGKKEKEKDVFHNVCIEV